MIDTSLIVEFVLYNNYYSRQLGPCIIPTFVFSEKSGRKIDIINNREIELKKSDSSYVKTFKKDINNISTEFNKIPTKYIEEFPVVIDNRNMWNQILDYYNIPKDSEIRDRQYFLLDFLFPNSGLIIEIDSDYHNEREVYDKARDHYLQSRYSLETRRFYKYGDNEGKRGAFIKEIKTIFKKYYSSGSDYFYGRTRYINQTSIIVDNYMNDNKIPLQFIDNLLSYVGATEITKTISITMADVPRIFPNFGLTMSNSIVETTFLDNIITILWEVFRIKLYIQSTTEYTLRDVLWILEFTKMKDRWKEFILQTNTSIIPRWIADILGKIPADLKDIIQIDSSSSSEDSGISEFLQALQDG